jgi:hypothetical protein
MKSNLTKGIMFFGTVQCEASSTLGNSGLAAIDSTNIWNLLFERKENDMLSPNIQNNIVHSLCTK